LDYFILSESPARIESSCSSLTYSPIQQVTGEITAVLEDGSERTVTEPGTILIQRGTLHRWENRGSSWTKVVAVVVDAKPVEVTEAEGKTVALAEGFFAP
jgi:quercetin dioxygenase-like cupin family protein